MSDPEHEIWCLGERISELENHNRALGAYVLAMRNRIDRALELLEEQETLLGAVPLRLTPENLRLRNLHGVVRAALTEGGA